jgi:integrase
VRDATKIFRSPTRWPPSRRATTVTSAGLRSVEAKANRNDEPLVTQRTGWRLNLPVRSFRASPGSASLHRADFVKLHFRPAIQAANEAIAKLPKDRRPAPLPERLRFYDLRHTCASLPIAQGASVKAVQAQLGHATACITLDTYGHQFPSEMDTLGDRLELVRDAAVARLGRTQHGPADDRLSETAGG